MAAATGMRYTFSNDEESNNLSPLFERMSSGEELQQNRQAIETLQGRVHELEHINLDLERRLESATKNCFNTERECVEEERKWQKRHAELEEEIKGWMTKFKSQEDKTVRLRECLSRTEQEMYRILQRKYELMRDPGGRGGRGSGRGGPGAGFTPGAKAAPAGHSIPSRNSHGDLAGKLAGDAEPDQGWQYVQWPRLALEMSCQLPSLASILLPGAQLSVAAYLLGLLPSALPGPHLLTGSPLHART
jgi:hypothetical protein